MSGRYVSLPRRVLCGAAAGAAGTTALNAATYLDMAVRGRGSSSTPERTVETLADKAHVQIPGDEETTKNRVSGLGPIMGILTGVGTGALLGAVDSVRRLPFPFLAGLATVTAMAGADAPMAAAGVTDPRSWAATDWIADALPHAAYGVATAAVLRLLG